MVFLSSRGSTAQAVDESDVNARRAFLAAYRERMSAASQERMGKGVEWIPSGKLR